VAQGRVDDLLKPQKSFVHVTVSDTSAAAQVIQSLPGVEEVHVNGGNSVVVSGVESQAVLNHLIRNQIVPSEITTQKSDLESLFMSLTSD